MDIELATARQMSIHRFMIRRDELIRFLNKFFAPYEELARGREMLVNGVQVFGDEEVTGVGLGVSTSLEFMKKAHERGCNFLIVHHGLGFAGVEKTNTFPPHLEARLRFLFQNEISYCGYHFLLDHHPEIGNNAWVIRKLGGEVLGNVYNEWGWYGRLDPPKKLSEVIKECERVYDHPSRVVGHLRDEIKTFAVVSGSGAVDYKDPAIIKEFLENKIELEIVGDMKEGHPAFAKEIGLTLAAFGHYNTETIGVKNLGEVIKKEFPSLPVSFIDVPNEL